MNGTAIKRRQRLMKVVLRENRVKENDVRGD